MTKIDFSLSAQPVASCPLTGFDVRDVRILINSPKIAVTPAMMDIPNNTITLPLKGSWSVPVSSGIDRMKPVLMLSNRDNELIPCYLNHSESGNNKAVGTFLYEIKLVNLIKDGKLVKGIIPARFDLYRDRTLVCRSKLFEITLEDMNAEAPK